MARVIHYDIVVGGASSWQWWLAISPYDYKDGLVCVHTRVFARAVYLYV